MSAIAGVILAAGMSRRFGSTKQLLKIDGKCLLDKVTEAATNSTLAEIYLVLGWQSEQILLNLPHLRCNPKIKVLYNRDYQKGMSSSVKCGLIAARKKYDHVMFFVADQPFISPRTINHLVEKYIQSKKQICIPVYQGQKGNPAIFGISYFDQLLLISGDRGGRGIISENADQVLHVTIENPRELFDIDTLTDLEKIGKSAKFTI